MELKEALKVLEGYVFFDESGEAIDTIVKTASLVEAMRGKLIVGENQSVQKCIDDCAAAYIANLPSVEEIYKAIQTTEGFTLEIARAIHALLVSKIRGEK